MCGKTLRKNKLHNCKQGYSWMHSTTSAEDLRL